MSSLLIKSDNICIIYELDIWSPDLDNIHPIKRCLFVADKLTSEI